ncbi:MAG: GIY-YIG nuclease family protein [Armatimonadota bacterium]
MWYVYIIRCCDNTLYTGITNDIKRRVKEHNDKLGGKYTRSRTPVKLVYKEKFKTRSAASSREMHIKGLTRKRKTALINRTAL